MPYQLIKTNGPLPPGGFEFQDRITGIHYKDSHSFFDDRVRQIIRDRLANRRLWTDEININPAAVALELSVATCTRLKNSSRFCTDGSPKLGNAPLAQVNFRQGPAPKTCPKCGSENLKPQYCKTCSSMRITGAVCGSCGHEISL